MISFLCGWRLGSLRKGRLLATGMIALALIASCGGDDEAAGARNAPPEVEDAEDEDATTSSLDQEALEQCLSNLGLELTEALPIPISSSARDRADRVYELRGADSAAMVLQHQSDANAKSAAFDIQQDQPELFTGAPGLAPPFKAEPRGSYVLVANAAFPDKSIAAVVDCFDPA